MTPMHELPRIRDTIFRLAAWLAIVGAAACGRPQAAPEWDVLMPEADGAATTRITGSVAYRDLEGGLYVLHAEDGTNYDPTNLPDAYRTDGTLVEADVIVRDDMASIGMVGPIVDVVRIRRTDDDSVRAAPEGEPSD